MFGIGGMEMLVIGVIALLIFGPKRLPELARSLGKGLAEFRRASSDLRRSIDLDIDSNKMSAPDPETEPPAQAGSPSKALPDSDTAPVAEPAAEAVAEPQAASAKTQASAQANTQAKAQATPQTPPQAKTHSAAEPSDGDGKGG